jgi:hypothetical protein
MKKIVLPLGLLSGFVFIVFMIVLTVQSKRGTFEHSEVVGYSTMILAFITVFIGIRRYREQNGGGAITFGKAFQVGILITLIACACYVISWEIVYYNFLPDFADSYAKHVVTQMQHDGASDADIAKKAQEMESFKRLYQNPAVNVGMTFLEVFPVGLIITLVSAAILRRKPALAT